MNIPDWSVRNPVLVNLLIFLVFVGGVVSYRQMAKAEYPEVMLEAVMVITVMPGTSPKEIEQLITIPLEEEIAKIDDIKRMESGSAEGMSSIMVEFDVEVDDVFDKLTEVQNQIQKVEHFPDEAEPPIVVEMRPPFSTVTVAVLGTAPEHEVKEFVDDLEDDLKNIDGVEEVRIAGLREREIWVEVDPYRLYSYGLSLADVAAALRRRNLNLSGGLIRMERGEFSVRTEAEFQNLDQIRETVLEEDENGYVYLRDIARVSDTFEERRSLARLDGQPSVNMTITKDDKSDAISLVETIREVVAAYESRLPAGTYTRIVDDSSIEIKSRLTALNNNLLLGLLLVVGSVTFFIGWRPAIMVAVGIPVSFLATFILVNAYGYSVNGLVLFGLILVLGLVVDDAIVVCENVYRHHENGMPLREAAVVGAREITMPVLATIMTSVAAFLPLLLMEGILGQFMSVIPVVVTLALLASLGEAFVMLPTHIAEWGGHDHERRAVEHTRPWLHGLLAIYRRVLDFFLRHRYMAVAGVVLLAMLTLNLAYTKMDFILFGGRDLEAFSVAVEAPPGASIGETARIVHEIEKRVFAATRESTDVESIRTEVGSIRRSGLDRASGVNLGEVSIDLVDYADREQSGHEIKDRIREAIADLTGTRAMNFEEARRGPPVGKPVMIRIKGDNFDTLREISADIQAYLHGVDGVKDVMDNFPPGKDEVRPVLDLDKAAALGLDVQTIATEIRGAFDGLEATRVYDGNEEIEVMVKYDAPYRDSLANLAEMRFATADGMVPFSNIARLERREGVAEIGHHNQKRAIAVTADVVPGVITSKRVNEMVMRDYADIGDRYPGYTLMFGGEYEDTQESMASMVRAFNITLIMIYVILGGLFRSFIQPFIVMFSVPFAFIGVVIGFFIMQQPLGMFSTVGIIALAGIVVNDSLILIDFINRRRAEGRGQEESIREAATMRVRPILLTSMTTILGLMPLCLGLFGIDEFLRPMALAIAWGLTFSTVLCLILIPCVYRIFDDISGLLLKRPLAFDQRSLERSSQATGTARS